MNGKDICNFLKQYRKELSEKNGIDYEIKDCSHGDGCKGTCPFCEKETDELYTLLREKENNGEVVDWTTSVELPDESFVLDTDKCADSSLEIGDVINEYISNELCGHEYSSKGLFDPDAINADYMEPLQGDFSSIDFSSIFNMPKKGYIDPDILNGDANENDIFPNENLSHMNELMGDIVHEPDYPETPHSELCEFIGSFETSEPESDKDDEVTLEMIKEVRSRTSMGFADIKEALRKCNLDVDETVAYLEEHCDKPLMGKISID